MASVAIVNKASTIFKGHLKEALTTNTSSQKKAQTEISPNKWITATSMPVASIRKEPQKEKRKSVIVERQKKTNSYTPSYKTLYAVLFFDTTFWEK